MSKASLDIVLAEDKRHQRFIRHYLYRLVYERHDLGFEPLPNGRGCGEQWVRERCSKAISEFQARNTRARTALVIAIDADVHSVSERRSQLSGDRSAEDAIAVLIPKRHIETWVLCLNGQHVDENTDYHARDVDEFIKLAATTVWSWSRDAAIVPTLCVESLRTALPEFRRIPQA